MFESDFQTKFNRWLKHIYKRTAAFELKLARDSSLPFSAVREHQEFALSAAKHDGLVYKISDESAGYKPFDCFMYHNAPAYVVIMFYKKGQKEFVMIDIDDWLKEKEISERRSLTESRAKEIGRVYSLS